MSWYVSMLQNQSWPLSFNRSLSCQRITLHKNLFWSYVLNSALTIIYLVAVVNDPEVVGRNPVSTASFEHFLQKTATYIIAYTAQILYYY